MKHLASSLSAIIVGVSLIIAALIFRDALVTNNATLSNGNSVKNEEAVSTPNLMTLKQLSEYLQISEKSIQNIINKDDADRVELGTYDTYSFIPYIKLDDDYRFLKTEIDKWLLYKNHNQ